MAAVRWRAMRCGADEVNLDVLSFGQSFRWRRLRGGEGDVVWQGIMANRIWQLKLCDKEQLHYRVLGRFSRCGSVTEDDDESALCDYFQLDSAPSLRQLYSDWSRVDPYFSTVALRMPAIRVLRQDPIECLFSFICSTNNNIKRITSMVQTLCRLFGEQVTVAECEVAKMEIGEKSAESSNAIGQKKRKKQDGEQHTSGHDGEDSAVGEVLISEDTRRNWMRFYDFPTVTQLAQDDVEGTLRANGFGYRAEYVAATARMLLDEFGEEERIRVKLNDLRTTCNLKEAREFLLKLRGVGPKVADCVSLMSLDKTDAVPVDTHVRTITAERYLPALKKSSLTSKTYDEIGDFYRKLFGPYAGWTHSVLFSAQVGGTR